MALPPLSSLTSRPSMSPIKIFFHGVLLTHVILNAAAQQKCTLYMAPTSTTAGAESKEERMKLSMYSGIDFEAGSIIGRPEISIPFFMEQLKTKFEDDDDNDNDNDNNEELKKIFVTAVTHFMWNPHTSSAQFETDSQDDVLSSIPGVGALGNQHPSHFANADWDWDALVNRSIFTATATTTSSSSTSSTGSSSPYYDMTLKAKHAIPQGMEILVGDLGVPRDEEIPSGKEYQSAQDRLDKMALFFEKHDKALYYQSKKQSIYEFLIKDVIHIDAGDNDNDNDKVLKYDEDNQVIKGSGFYPKDVKDVKRVLEDGGIFYHSHPELRKSITWLEEVGQCIDGIYVGPMTNPTILKRLGQPKHHYEKSAFATRHFKNGDVVAPAPLLLIPHKSYLEEQILINYSFGHADSSLLFYPYGMNVNYINHQVSSRDNTKIGGGPNVKLVWTNADYHQSDLLSMTPDEIRDRILEDSDILLELGMDIVAIRDIEPHEEIFLDYGLEWEEEWEEYTEFFDGTPSMDNIKALQLNSAMQGGLDSNGATVINTMYYYTTDEIESLKESDEYKIPNTIMTVCYLNWSKLDANDEHHNDEYNTWFQFDSNTVRSGNDLYKCEVIGRNKEKGKNENVDGLENAYEYTVKTTDEDGKEVLIKHVPQRFIKYADKPYTNDIHNANAFRHPIGIPDEIFPKQWRDL